MGMGAEELTLGMIDLVADALGLDRLETVAAVLRALHKQVEREVECAGDGVELR
jgi:hypothetical protein